MSVEFDYKGALLGLLAKIHRCGGRYVKEHGVAKAVDDAELVVAELLPAHPNNPKLAADRQIVAWIVYRDGAPPELSWSKPSAGAGCQPLTVSKLYGGGS